MDSLTLLYDFGKTKVLQRFFIAKGCKRKHRFLQVRPFPFPKQAALFAKKELGKCYQMHNDFAMLKMPFKHGVWHLA